MLSELKWRIYYEDGSAFSNLDGEFESAPSDGVMGVVVPDTETGRHIFHGRDYYFMLEAGTIADTDDIGPFLRRLGIVKFGRWAGDKPYKGALARMMDDPEFPRKSARKPNEKVTL